MWAIRTQLNEEQIELIQHVADAFSTAYARYEDFNRLEAAKQQVENTLADLKQAQTAISAIRENGVAWVN